MRNLFTFCLLTLILVAFVTIPVQATLSPNDVPYDSTNFTGNNSMTWTVDQAGQAHYRYDQDGSVLFMSFKIKGTVGGTPSTKLSVKLPNGLHAKNTVSFIASVNSYGTGWQVGFANVTAGGTTMDFQLSQPTPFSSWGAGLDEVDFVGDIEVQ